VCVCDYIRNVSVRFRVLFHKSNMDKEREVVAYICVYVYVRTYTRDFQREISPQKSTCHFAASQPYDSHKCTSILSRTHTYTYVHMQVIHKIREACLEFRHLLSLRTVIDIVQYLNILRKAQLTGNPKDPGTNMLTTVSVADAFAILTDIQVRTYVCMCVFMN
jgi:hypothetical protein